MNGKEKSVDLKPHGLEWWQKNAGKRGGPAGSKSWSQRKIGPVGERNVQHYAPMALRELTNIVS